MSSAATGPVHQVLPSPSVDLEMFCQSLVLQGLEVTSTFISYAESSLQRRYRQTSDTDGTLLDAMVGLWGWVQRKYRSEEAEATKELLLPLSQPVTYPLPLQRTDLIPESLEEVKTQLQLIHAVVDDLQEQTNRQLNGLQEQLRRVPTCRCEPQEKNTHVVASSTKTFPSSSNAQNSRAPMFEIKRLEVPMEAVHRPSTLHKHSDAILCWIIQAIDGSYTHTDGETEQGFPLHVAKDTSPTSRAPGAMHEILASAQKYVGQDEFDQQDGTNAKADQDPVMDIAQMYRVLARDDGL